MKIGEALEATTRGLLIARPGYHENWHLRIYDPFPPEVVEQHGYAGTSHLRACSNWPIPRIWNAANFDVEDILADDWYIVDPATVMGQPEVEIIPWGEADEA